MVPPSRLTLSLTLSLTLTLTLALTLTLTLALTLALAPNLDPSPGPLPRACGALAVRVPSPSHARLNRIYHAHTLNLTLTRYFLVSAAHAEQEAMARKYSGDIAEI